MKVMALVPSELPRNWFAPLVGSAICHFPLGVAGSAVLRRFVGGLIFEPMVRF
jgi:hypothetical protein